MLLPLAEVARRLGVSVWTVRGWVAILDAHALGEPVNRPTPPLREGVRLGKAVRIPEAEVQRLIAGGTTHEVDPGPLLFAAARARLEAQRLR